MRVTGPTHVRENDADICVGVAEQRPLERDAVLCLKSNRPAARALAAATATCIKRRGRRRERDQGRTTDTEFDP